MENTRADLKFGRLAVAAGHLTESQLERFLTELVELRQQGEELSLGKLLVRRSILSADDVRSLISAQSKELLVCGGCQTRYNIRNFDVDRVYYCKSCGSRLAYTLPTSDPEYDKTAGDSASDLPTITEEVLLARQNRSFGVIASGKDYLDHETVDTAVEESNRLGVRIGEYLLSEGLLHTGQVREILEEQGKRVLRCPECSKRYNVKVFKAGKNYTCPQCNVGLELEEKPDPRNVESEIKPDEPPAPASVADTIIQPTDASKGRSRVSAYDPTIVEETTTAGSTSVASELLSSNPDFEDRYSVASEIARGGMGAILDAVDRNIERDVAIKYLLAGSTASPEQVQRFIREAKVQGQLEHPNICPVHEIGLDDIGRPYFTMKKVKGRSLAELLDEKAAKISSSPAELKLPRLLETFLKACDAIAFAHSRGVIHRDLKPDNIMIGEFGEVLVMDWGLARLHGIADEVSGDEKAISGSVSGTHATLEGAILGTPAYMAPEQSTGDIDAIDERTDIYALGGVLYAILTLKPPVVGSNLKEILKAVTAGDITPASERAPNRYVPRELEAVAMKALSLKPEDRYTTVMDLREDIEAYLEGRTLSAASYGPVEVVWKWLLRNRAVSAALVAVLVVGIGLTLFVKAQNARAVRNLMDDGLAALETGKYADAVEHFTRVLGLDASHEEANRQLTEARAQLLLIQAKKEQEIAEDNERKAREAEIERRSQELIEEARQLHRELAGRMTSVRAVSDGNLYPLLHLNGEPDNNAFDRWNLAYSSAIQVLEKLAQLADRAETDEALEAINVEEVEKQRRQLVQTAMIQACDLGDFRTARMWLGRGSEVLSIDEFEDQARAIDHRESKALETAVQEVEAILAKARTADGMAPDYQEMAVADIVRRRGAPVVSFLLRDEHLMSEYEWEQRIVVEALGRMGDTRTQGDGGRDAVTALMHILESLDVNKDQELAVLVTHSLGLLADSRAEPLVMQKRYDAGEHSVYSSRTKTAVHRLGQDADERRLFGNPDTWEAFISRSAYRRQRKDYEGALHDVDSALLLKPGDTDLLAGRADLLIDLGKLQEAIAILSDILKKEPDRFDVLLSRGVAYTRAHQFGNAMKDFDAAKAMKPEDDMLLFNRSGVYQLQGKLEDAIKELEPVLDSPELGHLALNNQGTMLGQLGRTDEAEKVFRKAIELNPESAAGYFNLASLYLGARKMKDAIEYFTLGLERNPADANAYFQRGQARLNQRDLDGALADLNRAAELELPNRDLYSVLGTIYMMNQAPGEAIEAFTKAIAIGPETSLLLFNRGVARHAMGDIDAAESDYTKALELEPAMAQAYGNRGAIRAGRGEVKKAVADFQQVLKLDPMHRMKPQILQYFDEEGFDENGNPKE